MNSKKKRTILCFIILFIVMQHKLIAQTDFQYSSPGQSFNITLPAINNGQTIPKPYYTIFIETGNGRYIKNNQTIDGTVTSNTAVPYSYNIPAGSKSTITVSGWYDTTPRPPRVSTVIASNPGGQQLSSQNYIPPPSFGKPQNRIVIDPCVNIIVPGDTMAVAVTYKPVSTAGVSNVVAFYYNNLYQGGSIFSPISASTSYQFNNATLTPAIRNYNNERIYTTIPQELPENVRRALSAANLNYSSALFFLIPAGADESEKNIFLSLAPTRNSQSYLDSSTNYKALILQYNSGGLINNLQPQSATYPLGISLVARDPNGIQTSPSCLKIGEFDPINDVVINHKVTFQNDGAGDARKVVVQVSVPAGIKFPTGSFSATRTINGVAIQFKPKVPGIKNYYEFDQARRRIRFTMEEIGLPGTVHQRNVTLRRGVINFILKTEATPFIIPDCMYSDVSIEFFNRDQTSAGVLTATDLIKKVCGTSIRCPRLYVLNPGTQK